MSSVEIWICQFLMKNHYLLRCYALNVDALQFWQHMYIAIVIIDKIGSIQWYGSIVIFSMKSILQFHGNTWILPNINTTLTRLLLYVPSNLISCIIVQIKVYTVRRLFL